MKFKRIDDLYDCLDETHMVVPDKDDYKELTRRKSSRLLNDKPEEE